MKFLILSALATAASAFTNVVTTTPARVSTELNVGMGGIAADGYDIWSELQTLEGPSICYGPEGILIGKEELEIKEYDNFDMFRDALASAGLDKVLRQTNEKYTLLVPVNSGVLAFKDYLDEEILSYHIIKGDIFSDEFNGDLETLNGKTISARLEFRKVMADDAFIGQENNHTYGTKYPTDVMCENGIIHSIKHVLMPGYKAPAQFSPEVNVGDREKNFFGGDGQ
jgi:hypothetical protein